MTTKNVMIFGHGRVAQVCVHRLMELQSEFNVAALNTNLQFYNGFCKQYPQNNAVHINDNQRNTDQILETIEKQNIDFLFSVNYRWILPQEVLDAVDGRAYNLHPAKLPRYRGYYSISHVIANREPRHTITIHQMSNEVDLGNILIEVNTDLEPDETALSLYQKSLPLSRKAFDAFLERVQFNNIDSGTPQDPNTGWFYDRDAFQVLRKLTWNDPPRHVESVVRACFFPPYEPAYADYADRKYFLVPRQSPQWEGTWPFNKSSWEKEE